MLTYSLTSAASSFDILPIPSEKQYFWSTVLTSSSFSLRAPSLIPMPTESIEVEKHCPMRATYEATHLELRKIRPERLFSCLALYTRQGRIAFCYALFFSNRA